jgi:hypothetical protein
LRFGLVSEIVQPLHSQGGSASLQGHPNHLAEDEEHLEHFEEYMPTNPKRR